MVFDGGQRTNLSPACSSTPGNATMPVTVNLAIYWSSITYVPVQQQHRLPVWKKRRMVLAHHLLPEVKVSALFSL
jgi:hypothetical protein